MNAANCSTVANSWRATDGGQWWLRDTTYSAPDGNYNANCLLALSTWASQGSTLTPSNLMFDDNTCSYSSGTSYLCSTNDQFCLPGSYSATGYGSCSLCAAGTYSSALGASSSSTCARCAAGMYSSTIGATSSSTCRPCPSGYWSESGSSSGYWSESGSSSGYWSESGSSFCWAQCPAGQTPDANTDGGAVAFSYCMSCPGEKV
jgi:hypothetical protein